MATNPVGVGSVNFPINLPVDEKAALGRAAFDAGCRSVGEYLRKLILKGAEVENPELAARLREVRRQYYGAAFIFLFVGLVGASWVGDTSLDRARVARTSRAVRRIEGFEFDALEAQV